MKYNINKAIFYHNLLFTLLFYFFSGVIYSQDQQDLSPVGTGYQIPAGPPLNPEQKVYPLATFSPTETLPPSRQRESLQEQTNSQKMQPSTFWAGFTFAAQYGQFDKLPYTDIFLSPYIKIGPFFFMYEIPLRFDWNSSFITRMWTSQEALVSKIEMNLSYSKTNHIFKLFEVALYQGELLFQGHGRFFYDYNPNLYAPYESFKTFKFSLDVSYFGINYVLANIANPTVMSAEMFIKPFGGTKNSKLKNYKEFKIYAVYGVDLDPFQGYSQFLYQFSPNQQSPIFSALEVGIDIPIYTTKKDIFSIGIFGDYTQFFKNTNEYFDIKEGAGVSGGLLLTFISKIDIKFEISQALGYWQPRWVNNFYCIDRIYINTSTVTRNNKYLSVIPNLTYFTGSLGFSWPEKGIFFSTEFFGDFSNKDLWISLGFTLGNIILKQLSFSFGWTLRALYNRFDNALLDPNNSIFDINLKYHMMPNMYWGLLVKINGRIGNIVVNDAPTIDSYPFIFLGMNFSFKY